MGASTQMPHLCMVTEFLPGKSLFNVLHVRQIKLCIDLILSFCFLLNNHFLKAYSMCVQLARQAALGLNYLHTMKPPIIHRQTKLFFFVLIAVFFSF